MHFRWPLYQLDVKNAFLHDDLYEEVYMKLPEGLQAEPGLVCKLKKSIFDLNQSCRQWFAKLTTELTHRGFIQS